MVRARCVVFYNQRSSDDLRERRAHRRSQCGEWKAIHHPGRRPPATALRPEAEQPAARPGDCSRRIGAVCQPHPLVAAMPLKQPSRRGQETTGPGQEQPPGPVRPAPSLPPPTVPRARESFGDIPMAGSGPAAVAADDRSWRRASTRRWAARISPRLRLRRARLLLCQRDLFAQGPSVPHSRRHLGLVAEAHPPPHASIA